MKRCIWAILAIATVVLFVQPSACWAKRNSKKSSANSKVKAAQQRAQQRKKAKHEAFLKKKAEEGEKDWTLTGTLRGSGTIVQFVPDKAPKGEKQIAAITLAGKHRDRVENLLEGDKKLKDLIGRRATVSFYGKPSRHGSSLRFDLMRGGVSEWNEIRIIN